MNLFYIKIKNQNVLIASTINMNNAIVKHINDDVFFLKDEKIVGFNVFNFSNSKIKTFGRVFLTNEIKEEIENKLNYAINETNDYFKVGEIIACEKVPNTHLSKTVVDIGTEKLQIVCGAKNVRVGIKVVVATIGAIMNDGSPIIKGTLRGIDSYGMLCSAKELNLLNDKQFNDEGIIELNDQYTIGSSFKNIYTNLGK